MIAEVLKKKKEEKGLTIEALSKLSGVPVGTINKIFNGETKSPRYATLTALEKVLMSDDKEDGQNLLVKDAPLLYGYEAEKEYTVADYKALPEDVRAELIDGELIFMEAPGLRHQFVLDEIGYVLRSFIKERKGDCIVFTSPVDVQLDCNNKTMLQPDLMVICHRERMVGKGIFGAPDMVVEVVSPSTRKLDYGRKMTKYMEAGVREYWIVDIKKKKIVTYFFEEEDEIIPVIYSFRESVPVKIYGEKCCVDFSGLEKQLFMIP